MGAGTETYARTLALALSRRDHEVIVYSPFPGKVAHELTAAGIPVTEDIASAGHDVQVVPNPIDTSYYLPRRAIRRRPKNAVAITNHLSRTAWASIAYACGNLDIDVQHVGYPKNNITDVRRAIDEADLVFAVGRTALEAGSMARAVLIHDHNGCDGWLDAANYAAAAEFAFSGHRRWYLPEGNELAELIQQDYSPQKGREAREVVLRHHALDIVVPELERHYGRAIEIGRMRLPDTATIAPTHSAQLAYYQREIRRLHSELDAAYRSWSWRLLAPLRQLNDRVRTPQR